MKKLKKIVLAKLAKDEMASRELKQVLGGQTCCICGCRGSANNMQNAHANNVGGKYTPGGGYGNGAFA